MSETLKTTDPDSGEVAEYEYCASCSGNGGYDASTDCEVYDDWHECPDCEGNGYVPLGDNDKDVFDPKRDAWAPND